MKTITVNCIVCESPFAREVKRGRPAVKCPSCRVKENPNATSNNTATIKNIIDENPLIEEKKIPPVKEIPITKYRVMVGNLGLAFYSDDEKEAVNSFTHYSRASSFGFGQVGFERVQLWCLNTEKNQYEVLKDFFIQREVDLKNVPFEE